MVGVAGFEPATPSSRTRCATRLRYTPTAKAGRRRYSGRPEGRQADAEDCPMIAAAALIRLDSAGMVRRAGPAYM